MSAYDCGLDRHVRPQPLLPTIDDPANRVNPSPLPAWEIRPFRAPDEAGVVGLWHLCDLTRPWNDPHQDIASKLRTQPELFLVGVARGEIVGSVMAGYDGHRGWMYYLGVDPRYRRSGLGRALVGEAERLLGERGCAKVNLQVRRENLAAVGFYEAIGYREDDVISFGKRLEGDPARNAIPGSSSPTHGD